MTANWPLLPIGDVCKLINGRAFKPSDWSDAGTPIVRIQNLNDASKPFNYYRGEVAPKHLIQQEDILLSWSGTPGTSFGCFIWKQGAAILNQHIFRVHPDEAVLDREFFVHAVNSRLEEMIAQAHGGVGLRHITKGKLEAIRIPVPAKSEQRRVVARIGEAMARVDEIRRLRGETLAESRGLLPSLLKAVFSAVSARHAPVSIESLAEETRYGTSEKCSTENSGTPVLRIPNVAAGRVNFEGLKFMPSVVEATDRLALHEGDLLVVRTNGSPTLVGRCAVVPPLTEVYAYASYLIRVRLDIGRADPRYVSYFLASTLGRDQIAAKRHTSAGQFNINTQDILSMEVPLPTLPQQRELVAQMSGVEEATLTTQSELSAARAHDELLPSSILRKAFAGEL